MCGKSNTTTTQTSANPAAATQYYDLLNRAAGVAATPYVPYRGQGVAPVDAQQMLGIGNINTYAESAQPAFGAAAGIAANNAMPITPWDIQKYVNPWTQNVVDATQAQFNNQNQQQLQQVRGNAISQGAFGGNREAIAEAETANQQQLAQAPVLAQLRSQGYTQGVNTALSEQQAGESGAQNLAGIAGAGQNAALTGANAQIGAGTLEQQTKQAQDQWLYQQYLNKLAYPFQTTQWQSGIDTGVGSQLGGTSSTTLPPPSILGQIGGLGMLGLGAFGTGGMMPFMSGMFHANGGAVPGFDEGGGVAPPPMPYATTAAPYGASKLWVPQDQITRGAGPPPPPKPQQDDLTQQAQQVAQLTKLLGGGGSGGSSGVAAADAAQDAGQDFTDSFAGRQRGGVVPHYDAGGGDDSPVALVGGLNAGEIPFYVTDPQTGGIVPNPSAAAFMPPGAAERIPAEQQFSDRPLPPTSEPTFAPADREPTFSNRDLSVAATAPTGRISPEFAGPPPLSGGVAIDAHPVQTTRETGVAPAAFAPGEDVPLPPHRPSSMDQRFGELEDKYGLPRGYLKPVAKIESNYNPRSYNELSGAKGMFQFIPSTARQYGLSNPWDPTASADAAARFAADNADGLRKAGLPVTPGTLYLAHQQGLGGAVALLRNPDARAVDALASAGINPRNITANGGTPGMTARQFAGMWDRKVEGGDGGGNIPGNLYASARDGADAATGSYSSTAPAAGVVPGSTASGAPGHGRSGVAPSGIDLSGNSKLWPALMATGAGMLASHSPFPGVALGEGATAGLAQYGQLRREETAKDLSGRKLDMESKKLDAELEHWRKQLELAGSGHAETSRHNKAEEDIQRDYHQDQAERNKYTYYPGTGMDEHGNQVPGTWRAPTQTTTGEEPKFFPGMVQTGKPGGATAGGVAKWKYDTWLSNHPGDTKGAEEFVAGHKSMSEGEVNSRSLNAAQKDPDWGRLSPVDKEKRLQYYRDVLNHKTDQATPPPPTPQPGTAPAPGVPTSQATPPAGVPVGSVQGHSKSTGAVLWRAPDGSIYGQDGKLLKAPAPSTAGAP